MSNIYKILLITTEGCAACDISKNNIQDAIEHSAVDIVFEVKDYTELPKKFIKENKIVDYPTALFYVNDNKQNTIVGSYPSSIYLKSINMYFKY